MRPLLVVGLGLLVLPAARADVARRRSPVVEVVQKVSPAVVFIGTEQVVEPPDAAARRWRSSSSGTEGGHSGRRCSPSAAG